MKNIIEINNLSFKYSNEYVLNDINFKVQKGQTIGILGHNGAGKTTLFRNITGLLIPNYGEVKFTENLNKNSNNISYLPENNGIYQNLTSWQNLKFRGKLAGVNNKQINVIASNLLKKLHLTNIKVRKVRELSNGMKKRLGLACALMDNSEIIILDEPTNGIDPESLNILIELHKRGNTILISSHNLDFITKVASKVIILQEGKVIFNEKIDNYKENLNEIYLKYTKKEGDN